MFVILKKSCLIFKSIIIIYKLVQSKKYNCVIDQINKFRTLTSVRYKKNSIDPNLTHLINCIKFHISYLFICTQTQRYQITPALLNAQPKQYFNHFTHQLMSDIIIKKKKKENKTIRERERIHQCFLSLCLVGVWDKLFIKNLS